MQTCAPCFRVQRWKKPTNVGFDVRVKRGDAVEEAHLLFFCAQPSSAACFLRQELAFSLPVFLPQPRQRRMSFRSRFFVLSLLSLILLPSLRGQFYTLQTKTLRLVYYPKAHEFIVPHVAQCFENAFRFHSKLFDYSPSE